MTRLLLAMVERERREPGREQSKGAGVPEGKADGSIVRHQVLVASNQGNLQLSPGAEAKQGDGVAVLQEDLKWGVVSQLNVGVVVGRSDDDGPGQVKLSYTGRRRTQLLSEKCKSGQTGYNLDGTGVLWSYCKLTRFLQANCKRWC